MRAVENDEDWVMSFTRKETGDTITKVEKARVIFDKLCENNWNWAEPGILFWDNICNYNLLSNNKDFKYAGTNPCVTGDTLVSTTRGEIPIRELVGQTPDVYCMDEQGRLTIKRAEKVWKTRENALSFARWFMTCAPEQISSQVTFAQSGVDEQSGILLSNSKNEIAVISLSFQAKQPKRGTVICENAFIEIYDFPRGNKAEITWTQDGKKEFIEDGNAEDALFYELKERRLNMTFDKFTIKAQETVQEAVNLAQRSGQQSIEPVHLLKAIMTKARDVAGFIFQKLGVNAQQVETLVDSEISHLPRVQGGQPYLSGDTNNILQHAEDMSQKMGDQFVSVEPILLAIVAASLRYLILN